MSLARLFRDDRSDSARHNFPLWHTRASYSPECVEKEFCELRLYVVLREFVAIAVKIASWVWRSGTLIFRVFL